MTPKFLCTILLSSSLALAPAAFADTITYAVINAGTASGTTGSIGGVNFTFTGPYAFVDSSTSGQPDYFAQAAGVYTSAVAGNAPTDSSLIALSDSGNLHTITFSTPVSNLIFDEFSLGGGGTTTSYTFDTPFTVLSCGASSEYGGGCFSSGSTGSTATVLTGNEANGTIEFSGPISSLSFTTANGEFWNGFDLGLATQTVPTPAATPEPNSFILLGTGLLSICGAARRKFRR